MLAGFDDEVQVFDVHRADVFAGPAGGTGPEHITGHRGAVPHKGLHLIEVAAQDGVGLVEQVHLEVVNHLFR
jgi:hypothetical protein